MQQPPYLGVSLPNLVDYTFRQGINLKFETNPHNFGEYDLANNEIRLSTDGSTMRQVSTLAHELGHAHYGDTCSSPALEDRAWEYAALLLLETEQVSKLTAIYEYANQVANELGVVPEVVEAWHRVYQKTSYEPPTANFS